MDGALLDLGGCESGSCFTNVSRALQHNLAKIHNARNHIYGKNFKLKLCVCPKFQLEILIRSTISAIHKFQEYILESSRNVSETTPRSIYLLLSWSANSTPLVFWVISRDHQPGMSYDYGTYLYRARQFCQSNYIQLVRHIKMTNRIARCKEMISTSSGW